MAQRNIMHVLGSDEQDDGSSAVLRRFWSRAKPLSPRSDLRPDRKVVDLAEWTRGRRGPPR